MSGFVHFLAVDFVGLLFQLYFVYRAVFITVDIRRDVNVANFEMSCVQCNINNIR